MNISLLNPQQLDILKNTISQAQHIVICAHKSPDGDAVGSALAWKNYLENTGKTEVQICLPDQTPDFLHWLPNHRQILRYDRAPDKVKEVFHKADLVFCLDFNQSSRLDDMQAALELSQAPRILIDHHLDPDTNCALTISHPEMSSTSEIIFDLIWQLGAYDSMSCNCAACIYCGMMTDTGGFTYNSTRPEIYFIISKLLEKGINKDEIYNLVYHNFSANAIKLRAHIMLNKLNVIEELHAAYFTVTKDEMRKFHFIKGDMEGLVNIPQKIRGLKLSISLREDTERPNLILVSLRSSNGFHCQPMATRFFNGGGHADASGGKLFCTIEEAEQITLRALLAYKNELQQKSVR